MRFRGPQALNDSLLGSSRGRLRYVITYLTSVLLFGGAANQKGDGRRCSLGTLTSSALLF